MMDEATLALICRDVYEILWFHTIQHGTPPAAQVVTDQLALSRWEMKAVVENLRAPWRVEYGSLMPCAYGVWCQHNPAPAQKAVS